MRNIKRRLARLEGQAAARRLGVEPEPIDLGALAPEEQAEIEALAMRINAVGGLEGLSDDELGRFGLLYRAAVEWPGSRFNPRCILLPCSLCRIEPWHHRGGAWPDISDWPDHTCHRKRDTCSGCPSAHRAYEELGWGDPPYTFQVPEAPAEGSR